MVTPHTDGDRRFAYYTCWHMYVCVCYLRVICMCIYAKKKDWEASSESIHLTAVVPGGGSMGGNSYFLLSTLLDFPQNIYSEHI